MVNTAESTYKEYAIEEFLVRSEPYYRTVGDELELFTAAYHQHIPVLLKGPTGCGKTRFVEYMAWRLGRPLTVVKGGKKRQDVGEGEVRVPLVTIACHEDLTASDLVGRYLLDAQGTRWIDGPMTRAVKAGAILYLDEVVEARKDTTVLIHPLTDHRRILPVEKTGSIIEADDRFLLCISYNPGYQSALKDLKHSTRQRFISIEFYYPPRDIEAGNRAAGERMLYGAGRVAGQAGRKNKESRGAWPPRRGQHPAADLRRSSNIRRDFGPAGLSGSNSLDFDRRAGVAAKPRRSSLFYFRIEV